MEVKKMAILAGFIKSFHIFLLNQVISKMEYKKLKKLFKYINYLINNKNNNKINNNNNKINNKILIEMF